MKIYQFALGLIIAASVACSPRSRTEFQAPKVQDSFKGTVSSKSGEMNVKVAKTALETTDFLFQTAVIEQEKIPMFNGGKSRIVKFQKRGDSIFMLESSDGNKASKDLEQNLILASFPILSETSDDYVIDFNSGMNKIFVASDWAASDFTGSEYKPQFDAVKVQYSQIPEIRYENNHFVIRQIAQVEKFGMVSTYPTIEARYYLTPYVENKDFQKTISKGFKTFGFFELSPRLESDGETRIYATKWDMSKPIVFAVSANTPNDYKQAVRDGVLYWNKAFGKEIVKVVDAPVGVSAPDLNYNVVEWVNWDQAGFAYADAQMDPRTGQILHAQVYMTSVFAFGGKTRARNLLRKLQGREGEENFKSYTLKGFEGSALCRRDLSHRITEGLARVLSTDPTDAQLLRLSQDYVTEVVAHEIGHTLGLRHNFSGNLGSNFQLKERPQIVKDYLAGQVRQGLVPSSSSMEYQAFEEGAISGHQMKQPTEAAFPYDRMAIENLYLGKEFARADVPAFCTDTSRDKFLDCKTFDIGNDIYEAAALSQELSLADLKFRLLETFIAAKAPPPGAKAMSVYELDLNPEVMATQWLSLRGLATSGLTKSSSFFEVRRQYPYIGALNKDDVELAEKAFVEEKIKNNGGLSTILSELPATFADDQSAAFNELIDSGKFTTGFGPGGAYSFTSEELSYMKSHAAKYLNALNLKIREMEAKDFTNLKEIHEGAIAVELVGVLKSRAESLIFSNSGVAPAEYTVKDKEGNDVKVVLPSFRYSQDLRKQAAGLLAGSKFLGDDPAADVRKDLKSRWEAVIKSAVGDSDKLNSDLLPKAVKDWIKDAKAVLSQF